jgi:hypothetical protein
MAPRLRNWVGGTVAFCALVAVAYLPPQPPHEVAEKMPSAPEHMVAERVRSRLATAVWAWRTLERRDSLLREARAAGLLGENDLVLMADPSVPAGVVAEYERRLAAPDSMLRGNGSGGPLLVAVLRDTVRHTDGLPSGTPWGTRVTYVFPEATDGRTCLAIATIGTWEARMMDADPERYEMYRTSPAQIVGPCAYALRFGPPGTAVREWLVESQYLQAQDPRWITERDPKALTPGIRAPRDPVWWWWHNTPVELSACAAGNLESCRNVVLGKRTYRTDKELQERQAFARSIIPPGVAPQQRYWSIRHPLGWSSGMFLSDLLLDMGEERFARFWNSELTLDSAFSEAMDMSLEQWTERWAQAQIGIPERGPGVPFGTALLGIVLAGAIVGGGAVLVNRRQIR